MNAASLDPKIANEQLTHLLHDVQKKIDETNREAGNPRPTSATMDAQFLKVNEAFRLLERTVPTLKVMITERLYREELMAMMRTVVFVAQSHPEPSKHDKVMIEQALRLLARAP